MSDERPYDTFLAMIERNMSRAGPGRRIEHMFNVETGIRHVLSYCEPDQTIRSAADHLFDEVRKAVAGSEHDSQRAFEAFKEALAQSRPSSRAQDLGLAW